MGYGRGGTGTPVFIDVKGLINGRPFGTYSVTEFGAKGDGVTDDRAAIQAALDACSEGGGGTVYLPPGTYLLDSRADAEAKKVLNIPSNVKLEGAGIGATIFKVGANVPIDSPLLVSSETSDIELCHFSIDGNKQRLSPEGVGAAEDEGIDLKSAERCYIHDIYIHDCGTDAIDFDDCNDIVVHSCIMEDNGGLAVHVSGSTGISAFGRTIIANCISRRNGHERKANGGTSPAAEASAFDLKGSYNIVVNCISEDDTRGILVHDAVRCLIQGCIVRRPGGQGSADVGILVNHASASDIVIDGCVLEGQSGSGRLIEINNGSRIQVVNCRLHTANNGIYVSGGSDILIAQNAISTMSRSGVEIVGASGIWAVLNNLIQSVSYGVYIENIDAAGQVVGNILSSIALQGIDLRGGDTDGVSVRGNRGSTIRCLNNPTNCRIINNDVTSITLSGTGHIVKNNVINGAWVDDGDGVE